MRILRVAQKLYPETKGGGAYHVHALSRDQAAMGHDVTVLTIQREGQPRRDERDGYTILRQPATVSPPGNEVSVGIARRLWATEDVDVVHAHSHLYAASNLAAIRRHFDETPLALTNHGLRSQTAPRRVFEWYLRTVGRWTLDAADIVFTYTDIEREKLRELGVSTDVAVVPNGIDVERFALEGEVSERITGSPALLFVGRLVAGKRPRDAIEAFEPVVADHPHARLSLVGTGSQRADLEARVAGTGLEGHVDFLGHVPYEAMPALYRAADLFVLPSETEGVPRSVLEALATGTPVVTTELAQLGALHEHGGVGVPVGDVDALADVLKTLLADDARRKQLGRSGRKYVQTHHDWTDTVAATTEHLASLCR